MQDGMGMALTVPDKLCRSMLLQYTYAFAKGELRIAYNENRDQFSS